MASHKLWLEDELEEEYHLIAVHCSEESYKMAFMLNRYLGLQLKRRRVDLDFSINGLEVTFPLFKFEDEFQYTTYYLVSNKCKSKVAQLNSAGGLFDDQESGKTVTAYLLPELKKVDFFLKIESDLENIPLRRTLAQLNEIKEVISSYEVDKEQIKSTKNLIFH